MRTQLFIIIITFILLCRQLTFAEDIKIYYSNLENSVESIIPIYSDGKYNEIFTSSGRSEEMATYLNIFLSNCEDKSNFIVFPEEMTSKIVVQNLDKTKNFSLSVLTDVENSHLINPKLNYSNENLILSANDNIEMNITYDCNKVQSGSNPWSYIYFDIKENPYENGIINENITKNHEFSFIKFCEFPSRSYWSLIILMTMATLIVYYATKQSPIITDSPESQEIQPVHAVFFVLFGSLFLMILYFFLPYLITVLTILVILTSLSSLTIFFLALFEKHGPPNLNHYLGHLPYYGLVKMNELISFFISLCICISYVYTKNWILNNMIGISLVFLLIRSVRMPNYFVALLMLGFAFFYDIFWVFFSTHLFGKSVMAYVATNLNLPMKIICPILSNSPLQSCSLLGLGDMALPGFFISYCYYYDRVKNISIYHITSMIGYCIALGLCLICLIFFHSAQPALLYISPCVLMSVGYVGWKRGEFKELWAGIDEKYNSQPSKRLERMGLKENKNREDDVIEHDRDENYYNNTDNTVFEMRKEEV